MLDRLSHILGRRVTLPDVMALGAFFIGAAVTFLDLVGLWDIWGLKPAGIVTMLLVTTLLLYSVQEKWEIVKRNEALETIVQSYGQVNLVKGETELFDSAISALRSQEYEIIRIYAPVGLWKTSNKKKEWFKALAIALNENRVKEVRAVFGLPPLAETVESVVREELKVFENCSGASIRLLPPLNDFYKNMPGTGIVAFDDTKIGFAYAVHSHHIIVDSTIFVTKKEVVNELVLWFDRVWGKRDLPIAKDTFMGIELTPGLNKITQDNYPSPPDTAVTIL